MTTRFADHLLEGDHASRPAATAVPDGTLYSCTDHSLVYQSDGATWATWATLGGDISAHTGDTTDAHDASAISFDPTGLDNTSATDLQTAMEDYDAAISAAAAGGSFDEDLLPWTIDVNVFPTPITQTNWDTLTSEVSNGASLYTFSKDSTGAQNAEIGWDLVLAAGTWTFTLIHKKHSDRGIYSVQFDAVEKGTIDGYNAAASFNNRSTVAGIVVGTSGKVRVTLKMATKNASSSAYRGSIAAVMLHRTA